MGLRPAQCLQKSFLPHGELSKLAPKYWKKKKKRKKKIEKKNTGFGAFPLVFQIFRFRNCKYKQSDLVRQLV